jgi:hypothetical protein
MMNADHHSLTACVIERHIRSTCSSFASLQDASLAVGLMRGARDLCDVSLEAN